MATLALTNASVTFDSQDLSSHTRQVNIDYAAEMLDETAMGDTTRVMKGGLKTWSAGAELNQNFATGTVDDVLFSRVGNTGTLTIRPTATAVGSGNPNYTGTAILESYPPLGNSVGELATTQVSWQNAGALSRVTT